MRLPLALGLVLAASSAGVCAQQLRHPTDPPRQTGPSLRQLEPPARLSSANDREDGDAARVRCLQQAEASAQAAETRIASVNRQATAVETRHAARGGDAADPADADGLRAQRLARQRAVGRERNAASQQRSVARNNCR